MIWKISDVQVPDVYPHALADALDPPGDGGGPAHDAVAGELGARHHAQGRAAATRSNKVHFIIHNTIQVLVKLKRMISCEIPSAHSVSCWAGGGSGGPQSPPADQTPCWQPRKHACHLHISLQNTAFEMP